MVCIERRLVQLGPNPKLQTTKTDPSQHIQATHKLNKLNKLNFILILRFFTLKKIKHKLWRNRLRIQDGASPNSYSIRRPSLPNRNQSVFMHKIEKICGCIVAAFDKFNLIVWARGRKNLPNRSDETLWRGGSPMTVQVPILLFFLLRSASLLSTLLFFFCSLIPLLFRVWSWLLRC